MSIEEKSSWDRLESTASSPDVLELVAMCRELNQEDPGPHPVPDENMCRTLTRLRQEPSRGCAVVLQVGGRAVGYALLITFWSNELGGEVCVIDELFVRRAFRGRGYATELVRALIQRERPTFWPDRPVAVSLEVRPENARAQKLYAWLGFKAVPTQQLRIRIEG